MQSAGMRKKDVYRQQHRAYYQQKTAAMPLLTPACYLTLLLPVTATLIGKVNQAKQYNGTTQQTGLLSNDKSYFGSNLSQLSE